MSWLKIGETIGAIIVLGIALLMCVFPPFLYMIQPKKEKKDEKEGD